jgi:hypothetical protein
MEWRPAAALVAGLLAAFHVEAQAIRQSPLPAPSGEFSVGRTQFDWTDESRADPEGNRGHREIVVWVWYPAAQPSGAEPAEWMPGKWGELFWSDFVDGHPNAAEPGRAHPIATIRTHAFAGAPAASAKQQYPVLLFAPGLGADPLQYASLIEDVVSHGYIVAGIVPTYFSAATVFSDGRVARGRDIMTPGPGGAAIPRTTAGALQRYEQVVGIWSADLVFALNQLGMVNADARSPLNGLFDFTRVGAIGHSLGGAGVLQFAHDEPRVRAVFDIDGSPVWKAANGALARPLLILSAASTNVGYDAVLRGAKSGLHLRMSGTTHTFSSDLRLMPFQPPVARNPAAIDPARALAITAAYAAAFFDLQLKGKASSLLSGPSAAYPEIAFER